MTTRLDTPISRGFSYLTLFALVCAGLIPTLTLANTLDNEPATANLISVDDVVNDSISYDNDVDWFVFDATIGTTYTIEALVLSGSNPDIVAEIYSSDGNVLAINDDGLQNLNAKLEWKARKSEPIYLKLMTAGDIGAHGFFSNKGGGDSTCDYQVTVTATGNSSPVISQPVVVDTTVALGEALTLSIDAADPDGDELRYDFRWGDGVIQRGDKVTRSHTYSVAGDYCIQVRARDLFNGNSAWSDCINLSVIDGSIPETSKLPYCSVVDNTLAVSTVDTSGSPDFLSTDKLKHPTSGIEKPFLFRLNNGQYAAVYTAVMGTDPWRSVVFQNTGSNLFSIVQPFIYEEGKLNTVMYARGTQLSNGTILIAFAQTDMILGKDKSIPSQTKIRVYESTDEGLTWTLNLTLASDFLFGPEWSGLWQPALYDRGTGHVTLMAVEQKTRVDPYCEDTGLTALRDDSVIMFESTDFGKTFPIKRLVYSGLCGHDSNEPALVIDPAEPGVLSVIFHDNVDDGLYEIKSTDDGLTWSSAVSVIPGIANHDTRYPVITYHEGSPTLIFRRVSSNENYFEDYFQLAKKTAGTWSIVNTITNPPPTFYMCKLN